MAKPCHGSEAEPHSHSLVCLRGFRTRRVPSEIKNVDIDVEVVEGAIQSDY